MAIGYVVSLDDQLRLRISVAARQASARDDVEGVDVVAPDDVDVGLGMPAAHGANLARTRVNSSAGQSSGPREVGDKAKSMSFVASIGVAWVR